MKSVVLMALCFSGAAFADALTLKQVLDAAAARAPRVQAAARALAEAEASRVGQGVWVPVNPRLSADYRPLAIELPGQPSDPRHGYFLGLDGQVEVSGAAGARLREADLRVAVARDELRREQGLAMAEAWQACIALTVAQERVASLQTALALENRVLQASKERLSTGVASEADVTTVAVEVAAIEVALEEARRTVADAQVSLALAADLPTAQVQLADLGLQLPEAPALDGLVTQALERRPELAALRARIALLEASDDRLVREAVPRLGLNFGLDAAPASPVFAAMGVQVELPVAQRNQGPRAVAAAQRDSEKTRLQNELRRVTFEVERSVANYRSRRAQALTLQRDALPNAQRTVALIETGWTAGRFDVFRLTAATRDLIRAQRDHLEAVGIGWADFIELQRVTGALAP